MARPPGSVTSRRRLQVVPAVNGDDHGEDSGPRLLPVAETRRNDFGETDTVKMKGAKTSTPTRTILSPGPSEVRRSKSQTTNQLPPRKHACSSTHGTSVLALHAAVERCEKRNTSNPQSMFSSSFVLTPPPRRRRGSRHCATTRSPSSTSTSSRTRPGACT
jgi:hypothetical protein